MVHAQRPSNKGVKKSEGKWKREDKEKIVSSEWHLLLKEHFFCLFYFLFLFIYFFSGCLLFCHTSTWIRHVEARIKPVVQWGSNKNQLSLACWTSPIFSPQVDSVWKRTTASPRLGKRTSYPPTHTSSTPSPCPTESPSGSLLYSLSFLNVFDLYSIDFKIKHYINNMFLNLGCIQLFPVLLKNKWYIIILV